MYIVTSSVREAEKPKCDAFALKNYTCVIVHAQTMSESSSGCDQIIKMRKSMTVENLSQATCNEKYDQIKTIKKKGWQDGSAE